MNDTKQEWVELNNFYKGLSLKFGITENSVYDIISDENSKKEIYNILNETEKLLVLARSLTANMYEIIDNSIISSNLTQSQLDLIRLTNSNYQDNIEKMLLSVE